MLNKLHKNQYNYLMNLKMSKKKLFYTKINFKDLNNNLKTITNLKKTTNLKKATHLKIATKI